jgi:hypothetical protein
MIEKMKYSPDFKTREPINTHAFVRCFLDDLYACFKSGGIPNTEKLKKWHSILQSENLSHIKTGIAGLIGNERQQSESVKVETDTVSDSLENEDFAYLGEFFGEDNDLNKKLRMLSTESDLWRASGLAKEILGEILVDEEKVLPEGSIEENNNEGDYEVIVIRKNKLLLDAIKNNLSQTGGIIGWCETNKLSSIELTKLLMLVLTLLINNLDIRTRVFIRRHV